jgi:hypothetical protein
MHGFLTLCSTQGDGILSDDMLEDLDIITPLDTCGYFNHTGYFLVTVICIVSSRQLLTNVFVGQHGGLGPYDIALPGC